jgi:hypothetical protein
MKRVLLLMVISALLVTLGFAQTPAAGGTPDPANVKGCLGGSDGNYTVTENGTRQVFKITTSSVDLKLHVGHDVKLIGHKTSGAASSNAAGSSLAVTDLSMISEHCAAAAAATVGAVVPYSQTVIEPTSTTPSPNAPVSTPAMEAAAPAAAVSPSPALPTAPAVDAAAPAPAATVSPSAVPAGTPTVEAAAPAATVNPAAAQVSTPPAEATVSPSATVSGPSEKATHSAGRPSAPRRLSATQDKAAAAPAPTDSPKAADAATTVTPSPEVSPAGADAASASPSATTVTPDAAATPPAVTHRTGSLTLLLSFVVLVIVLGTLIPFIGRWRKRKMLEQTGTPNLSFTNEASTNEVSPTEVGIDEASSDQHKPEPSKVA